MIREAFLERAKSSFLEILLLVEYSYATEPVYFYCGKHTIRSITGTQKGDPLGPLIFFSVSHYEIL